MKIGIIATHSFPIPYPNLHTGDIVILNLANCLQSMGHEVTLYAPEGTAFNNLKEMKCGYGKYPPSSQECEQNCYVCHEVSLHQQDIVHDFSITKQVEKMLNDNNYFKTCSTLMGGCWPEPWQPRNLIVWSDAHRDRVLRGASDYENTPTPHSGINGVPVSQATTIFGGIDTNFYQPGTTKSDYFLWLGRWHQVRGYQMAIEIAVKSGIKLVLAGEHPDNELFDSQRETARMAEKMIKPYPNISLEWLPPDPDHHQYKLKLLQEAKALLYTAQFNEPFGLTQVESLACGTPVIATHYGSMPQIINQKVGYICHDVDQFISACQNLNISSEECRNYAVQNFDISCMAKNLVNFYQNIINKQE